MKRHFLLTISVLALTAISQPLFAAEAEMPAPERAPAAERAPARQRAARPARERAPVQRQAAQSSPNSSFTGSQVGGFGGGNAGGGGFADPATCPNGVGGFYQFLQSCGTTIAPVSRSQVAASGGAEYAYNIPFGPYWVVGVAVDATGSGLNSSTTQISTKVVGGTALNETYSVNQRQPFTATYRARIGVVAFQNAMIFLTAGGATGKVSGNYAYYAQTPGNPNVAAGIGSWNETRTGYVFGGGVSVAYIQGGPRVTVEYLYTNLGTVNQAIPVVSGPNFTTGFASMDTKNSTVRVKLSW
jgi:hypothetical protein